MCGAEPRAHPIRQTRAAAREREAREVSLDAEAGQASAPAPCGEAPVLGVATGLTRGSEMLL
jgi:hypothetical protein